jgi:hypothetical protein
VRPTRVKLFWKNKPMKPGAFLGFSPTGKNAPDFEAEMNGWLQGNHRIKIVDIKRSASGGSFAGSLWLILVSYEEGPNLIRVGVARNVTHWKAEVHKPRKRLAMRNRHTPRWPIAPARTPALGDALATACLTL